MSKRLKSIYLAIALTTNCNYSCFYCKKTGESKSEEFGTLNFEHLKKIIKVAYKVGLNCFRITGGEPTTVSYLPELIRYIMNLGNDTKIRINTNGYRMDSVLNLIENYKTRIDIVISVDSLNSQNGEFYYPKYLSEKIKDLATELIEKGIRTRFNIVVTKYNVNEIPELILKSLELGVHIKLLDLNIQDEYLGNECLISNLKAKEFWNASYQSLDIFKDFLEKISDNYKEEHHQLIAYGVPMSAYFKENKMIQLKDSTKGAQYSEFCINKCPYFLHCQEGMFSPFLSIGEILHVSGCCNKDKYWYLNMKNEEEIEQAFIEILKLFENTSVRKNY